MKKPFFVVCSWCGRLKTDGKDTEVFYSKEEQIRLKDKIDFSHGICKVCKKREMDKLRR